MSLFLRNFPKYFLPVWYFSQIFADIKKMKPLKMVLFRYFFLPAFCKTRWNLHIGAQSFSNEILLVASSSEIFSPSVINLAVKIIKDIMLLKSCEIIIRWLLLNHLTNSCYQSRSNLFINVVSISL